MEATGKKGLLQRLPVHGEVGVHLTISVFQTTCYSYQMFSKAGLAHGLQEVFYLCYFFFNFWYGKYFSVRSTVTEYQGPTQMQTDAGAPTEVLWKLA